MSNILFQHAAVSRFFLADPPKKQRIDAGKSKRTAFNLRLFLFAAQDLQKVDGRDAQLLPELDTGNLVDIGPPTDFGHGHLVRKFVLQTFQQTVIQKLSGHADAAAFLLPFLFLSRHKQAFC